MSYMEPTLAYENKGFSNDNNRPGNFNGSSLVQRGAYRQLGPVKRIVVPLSIMSIEMFERMTFFTITSGILFYSVLNLNYNLATSGLMTLVLFTGGAYMTAPFGGYLADAFLGRFYTIMLSTIVYIAGLAVLVTGSFDSSSVGLETFEVTHRSSMTLAGLIMIVIGTGGIKANVAPFGADQIRALGDETVTSYFNWYYFVINIGSVVAVMGLSQLQTEMYIGKSLLLPLCGMTVSLLVFAAMHVLYVKYRPERHNLSKIMCQGCSKCTSEGTCFAGAMETFGGSQPDHVVIGFSSAFKTGLLIIFVLFVWVGVSLLAMALPLQSERMDRRVGSTEIPDWLYRSFMLLAVLLAIPFLALGALPLLRGLKLTLPWRIGLGLVFVALGLLASGAVETQRKDTLRRGLSTVKNFPASPYIVNYTFSDPTALEIVKNVTETAMQALEQKYPASRDAAIPVSKNASALANKDALAGTNDSSQAGNDVSAGTGNLDAAVDVESATEGIDASVPNAESESTHGDKDNSSLADIGHAATDGKDTLAPEGDPVAPMGNPMASLFSNMTDEERAKVESKVAQIMRDFSEEDEQKFNAILGQFAPQLTQMSTEIVFKMLDMLPQMLPLLENIPSEQMQSMMGMLPQMLPLLENISSEQMQSMMGMLPQMLPLLENISSEQMQSMMAMLPQMLPLLENIPPKQMQSMMGMLPQMLPLLGNIPPEQMQSMMGMLPQMLPLLEDATREQIKELFDAMVNMPSTEVNIPLEGQKIFMGIMPRLIPTLLRMPLKEIGTTFASFMGSTANNSAVMVAVHLVLNTPDGFPLWRLRMPLNVSHMSVLTQIPQFMFIGIGEALAAVAGFELAYHQAPFAFQGLTTGLYVMAMGMGSFVSGSIVNFIDGLTEVCSPLGLCAGTWFSPTGGDINTQNMDYMMYLVAGIVFFIFLLYAAVITWFYRVVDPMSFGELEESDLPGIELKSAGGGDMNNSITNRF